MCGRFGLTADGKQISKLFEVHNVPTHLPEYNIPPTRSIIGIRQEEREREASLFRWGLIPSWAKDDKIGYKLINARAETVAEKPSFRSALKKRRLIIPASYYFEWKDEDGSKQPYLIRLRDAELFGFAGLWEAWTDSHTGEVIDSCTIITTAANAVTRDIHDRMPVILRPSDYAAWLNVEDAEETLPLLRPFESERIEYYPVTKEVGKPTYDQVECTSPL